MRSLTNCSHCRCRFGKQVCYIAGDLVFQMKIEAAASTTGKTRVDSAHQAVAADEEGCWPRIQVFRLWDFLIQLVGLSGDQVNVIDLITLDEGMEAGEILELIGLFEIQSDDLESLAVILPVKLFEKRSFIVAVRAPTAGDVHQYYFAAKARVGVRHDVSIQIGKAETERFISVLELRVLCWIIWRR